MQSVRVGYGRLLLIGGHWLERKGNRDRMFRVGRYIEYVLSVRAVVVRGQLKH